ncbi:MAG: TIGR01777 family oxidoreductase [Bacteroidetes bacterium]|jgi:hypothetical protein|nr:TIGR01777 family oxidoreductase [Bacteroidota bacterium]
MNIVVAGGTGLIGQRLVRQLTKDGHHVVILSRDARPSGGPVRYESWNGRDAGPWIRSIEEADAVINLSGASVAEGRWTTDRKRLIRDSRILATRAIVQALRDASRRTRVLVNASGVGYYGSMEEGSATESLPPGQDFLAQVCRQWEDEARAAEGAGARVAFLRTGMVLDPSGGALTKLMLPFRFFVGGPLGTGRQWVSWVHHADMVGSIVHVLNTEGLSGPINIAAPAPVRMKEFCATLGRVMRRPSWAPVPSLVLELALGEMSWIILTGQKALPDKLVAGGYRHRFADLERALRDAVGG